METQKRAAIYIRVSSREQATDDKVSLEVQQRDSEAYCRRRGYEIVTPPYVDIQSGTDSRKERASFERMLADARNGVFTVIVAWRPDRLFRSLWPAARLKQVMDATGVEVETATQSIDKTTIGLWAWLAEREIENIRERTLMGREAMARAGKLVTGNPAYGLKYDPTIKHIRHDDSEKPRVIAMFDWVDHGKSIGSLVAHLNSLGLLTRRGKSWRRQQVVKVLRNPVYMGKAYWGKHEVQNSRKVTEGSPDERILIPVTPIITEEQFNRVQQRLDKNRKMSPRNTHHTYLLQKLLYCRSCNHAFRARSRTSRNGKPLEVADRSYECRGMQHHPGAYHCRQPAELKATTLEDTVWNAVAHAFSEPQSLLEILKARNTGAAEQAAAIRREIETARHELDRKNLELQQLLTWARERLLTAEELRPQLARVREQRAGWEGETARLNHKLASVQTADNSLADAEQLCATVRSRLADGLTDEEKKEFLQLVVERIWVDKDNDLEVEVIIPRPKAASAGVNCETVLSPKGRGNTFSQL